jgi:phospholipid/cholesterol/gamma-HCH transport system permease protein
VHPFRLIEALGRAVIRFIESSGRLLFVLYSFLIQVFQPPYRIHNIFLQMENVGVNSIGIVLITGLFTGMVFAVQLYISLQMFSAGGLVGAMVALSLTRELSPVFCALMVTGRVGSAMAATLGSMRVSEQIDALEAMAVNPIHYLMVPRVLAAMFMMPLLVVVFDAIGIAGAYLVSIYLLHVDPGIFVNKLNYWTDPDDFWKGLIKGGVFGLIFAVVGCSKGFYTTGGADGVGRSTTQAVVVASVLIFISDYFLTTMMW